MTKTRFTDTQRAAYALIAATAEQDHAAVDAILGSCDLRPVARELAVLAAGQTGGRSGHSGVPGIGLRQAVAQGLIPVSLDGARTTRHRDPDGFPPVVRRRGLESLYDPGALRAYYASRSAP